MHVVVYRQNPIQIYEYLGLSRKGAFLNGGLS